MSSVHLPPSHHHYFTAAIEQKLDADDTAAFSAVTGILLCIVTGGLVLGIVSVLAIVASM